jgi:hypothetical protein
MAVMPMMTLACKLISRSSIECFCNEKTEYNERYVVKVPDVQCQFNIQLNHGLIKEKYKEIGDYINAQPGHYPEMGCLEKIPAIILQFGQVIKHAVYQQHKCFGGKQVTAERIEIVEFLE